MLNALGLTKLASRHLPKDTGDFDKSSFSAVDPDQKAKLLQGGAIGGALGAIAGGAIAHSQARDRYEASTQASSVNLEWQRPVIVNESIGQIPKDEKIWATFWDRASWFPSPPSRVNPDTRPIMVDNPSLDSSGRPMMATESHTFTGYGEPRVSWTDHSVAHRTLNGYDRSVTSRYDGQIFCQSNFFPPEDESLSQWCVSYRPKIDSRVVGSFKTPSVQFELSKEVASELTAATMKGAAIGLVSGVALGVLGGLLASRH